eukprot:m.505200 g.505200  ORF g.505200 m.505200 type:complete len:125 (+) comp57363_c0_seq1:301-675(+)
MPIKGSCLTIEKEFLRLTAAPNAALVRPLAVLQQALVHVQKKWQQEPNYKWAWSQLKSIRQDLTIQGIRNEFTVKVYETHARICLQQVVPYMSRSLAVRMKPLDACFLDSGTLPSWSAGRPGGI